MRTAPSPPYIGAGILEVLFRVILGHRDRQPGEIVGSEPLEARSKSRRNSFSPEWRGAGRSIFCQPISKLADGAIGLGSFGTTGTRASFGGPASSGAFDDRLHEAQKFLWNPGSEVVFFVDATEHAGSWSSRRLDAEELSDEYFTLKIQVDPGPA